MDQKFGNPSFGEGNEMPQEKLSLNEQVADLVKQLASIKLKVEQIQVQMRQGQQLQNNEEIKPEGPRYQLYFRHPCTAKYATEVLVDCISEAIKKKCLMPD